ncbi:MAG TPA: hypothetical protein VJ992_10900 [Gemmatimonadales bacterium]|nr:hypothetical protein [Gemmatimonadales bacterium]
MKPLVPLAIALGLLAACQTKSPTELATTQPALSAAPSGLNAQEQGLLDALKSGEDPGAIIDRNVGCGLLTGFFNNGAFVAFGGLFPTEGPQGICPLSNFTITHPDGSVDTHMQGTGAFFLVIMGGPTYSSDGSHVTWRVLTNEGGGEVFTVTGTLSDGSRVRAHIVTTPNGSDVAASTLWVEGLGYVVGGPAS